jgi:molybdenum cofactor cytidylyltransferase
MRLFDALRVQRGETVAFVGAGGKTAALLRLARELRSQGWRVLATTTTRLARHEIEHMPLAVRLTKKVTPTMISQWLNEYGFVFLYGAEDTRRSEIVGLHPDMIAALVDSVDSDALLIEADGAQRLPLKAPYDHEPVVPPDASLVVPVAGVDALGQPLDDDHIYNAARIRARYGFPEGGALIPPWMAVTIRDSELGLRGIPDSARVVALLNKVPGYGYERARARHVAQMVLRSPRVEAVALGSMQSYVEPVHELQRRVGAVVLAAGMSTRMGHCKPLLPWDGRTVIEAIVSRLVLARVAEIVVVTGYKHKAVRRALADLPVRIMHNPAYASGEMLSSLKVGLGALSGSTAACLVTLGDQPSLSGRVIGQIIAAYAEMQGEIIAPVYRGQQGHPVLFDRHFWPELIALADGVPRDVMRRHPDRLALITVHDDSILRDIDTPQQYDLERRLAGLRRE